MATFTAADRTGGGGFQGKIGTYLCTFTELDEQYEITLKGTGETVTRYRWIFQKVDDPTTEGQIDTITSPSFKPQTNGLKFLTGMLGRAPVEGDRTDGLIGRRFNVTWSPNQAGTNAITNVVAVEDELLPDMPKVKPELKGAALP